MHESILVFFLSEHHQVNPFLWIALDEYEKGFLVLIEIHLLQICCQLDNMEKKGWNTSNL